MGFIKAAAREIGNIFDSAGNAISGTLKDKFKDVIECPNMGNNILMMKKTTESGRISRKSIILVQPSQMVVIIDGGRVMDATAEEGAYLYDESTTPCFFAGDFGASFRDMWERFTFGGGSPNQQAVYYFNMKEITDNGFGTSAPINFSDWMHAVSNPRIPGGLTPMSVKLTARGKYSFKLFDPPTFMREIAGTAPIYEKTEITNQMRSEVIASFQSILNRLGSREYCVGANDLLSKSAEIKTIMDQEVFDAPIRNRGIKIVSFTVEGIELDRASMEKIDKWELGSDAFNQQAVMTEAYADSMRNASSNEAGVMNGFMGLGIMNMNSGGAVSNVAGTTSQMMGAFPGAMGAGQMAMANAAGQMANMNAMPVGMPGAMQSGMPNAMQGGMPGAMQGGMPGAQQGVKMCPKCNIPVPGKFCPNCGTKMEEEVKKICPKCGAQVKGKFCSECGFAMTEPSVVMCPDCHIEVKGKFCPNCGRKMQ